MKMDLNLNTSPLKLFPPWQHFKLSHFPFSLSVILSTSSAGHNRLLPGQVEGVLATRWEMVGVRVEEWRMFFSESTGAGEIWNLESWGIPDMKSLPLAREKESCGQRGNFLVWLLEVEQFRVTLRADITTAAHNYRARPVSQALHTCQLHLIFLVS